MREKVGEIKPKSKKTTSGWDWQSPESVAYAVEMMHGTSINSCIQRDEGSCGCERCAVCGGRWCPCMDNETTNMVKMVNMSGHHGRRVYMAVDIVQGHCANNSAT